MVNDTPPTPPSTRREQYNIVIHLPREIIKLRRSLYLAGVRNRDIAHECDVVPSAVSHVLHGRGKSQHIISTAFRMLADAQRRGARRAKARRTRGRPRIEGAA